MTINDLHDLVRLLSEHPEWQTELRRILLTEELLELPSLVRQLVEAQRRTEEQVAQLAETQRQMSEAQRQTEEQVRQLVEAQRQTQEQVRQLIEAQRRTEEQLAQLAETQRQMGEAQRQTEEQVRQLIEAQREMGEAQRQTEEQVRQLVEAQREMIQAQQRTEEELRQLTITVARLVEESNRMREWQRGEAGRREGERYERNLLKRAALLFVGGQGGAPDNPIVQARLVQWLRPLVDNRILSPQEDPSLADIIWWKGDKVLIGEASLKIDRHDVLRVVQWAKLLRSVGVDATPFVAGTDWATPEAQQLAEEQGVEWLIDSTPSPGLIAFRRLPDPATAPEPPPAG